MIMAILKNTENDSVKSSITSVFYMKSKRCEGLFFSSCYYRCIHFPLCADDYKIEKVAQRKARAFLDSYFSVEENLETIKMEEDFD